MGSGTLFGLYVLFKYFGKEYINYLLTGYFAILGAFSVAKMLSLIVKQLINTKKFTWNEKYRIKIWTKKGKFDLLLSYNSLETHLKTSIDYINIGAGIIAVYLKVNIITHCLDLLYSILCINKELDCFKYFWRSFCYYCYTNVRFR